MKKIGIYEFPDETTAINEINNYYINMSGDTSRPVTDFYEVTPNISFKKFNNYINGLDNKQR